MSNVSRRSLIALAFCLAVYPFCGCASENLPEPPELGSVLGNFELKDLAGNTHTLEQYRGKVVVIEMASQHCPWSRGADPHLVELSQKYADDGVVFIGIDSHNDTSVEAIKAYAEEHGKSYTILKDEGNKYADAIGAKVTPEIYVVDKEGNLRYHGAFDDRGKPEDKGENAYTDKAIAAVLAGETPDPARVRAWGCTIKRK